MTRSPRTVDPPWLLAEAGALTDGATVELDREEAAHLTGALRLGAGDPVMLADGRGRVATGVVAAARGSRATVTLATVRELPPAAHRLTLALGVLHGQAMDWAVQKAVEIGVHRLVPLTCARAQGSPVTARARLPHWRRAAGQALKQCHRAWEMELGEPASLDGWLAGLGGQAGVVADREGGSLPDLPSAHYQLLLVGPEGGLCDDEKERLAAAGWPRLRLGPYFLRAETAATVGAALLLQALERAGASGPGTLPT